MSNSNEIQNNSEEKTLISCIICFHNEGYLAHTTLLSMDKVRKYAEERGFLTELIVVLDKIDELTERIVTEHPCLRKTDTVIHTQFGNPADSRNEAVKHCNGCIAGIFDGDDYFSENYLYECAVVVKNNKNIIAHPDCILSFEKNNYIMWLPYNENYTRYDLVKTHYHSAIAVAYIDVFKAHPYASYNTGFSYEDWAWNAETYNAGYYHLPVAKTILFYRTKNKNSQYQMSANENGIIGRNPLFDNLVIPSIDDIIKRNIPNTRNIPEKIPKWIQEERLKLAEIDAFLHPKIQGDVPIYKYTSDPLFGWLFALLYAPCKGIEFDFVYLVSCISPCSKDLMIIDFANQMSRDGFRVSVISTLPVQNTWRDKLNKQIIYIDFGNNTNLLNDNDKNLLLVRLLIQMKIHHLHCINSLIGYEVIKLYNRQLSTLMKINCSFFCSDQLTKEVFYTYITYYAQTITECYNNYETNNTVIPQIIQEKFGIKKTKIKVVYGKQKQQPYIERIGKNILCYERISINNIPDLLLEITKLLPLQIFHIYCKEELEEEKQIIKEISKQHNVVIHNEYDGFQNITLDNIGCFLFTSTGDGLSNVLLEAASHSLPIVATNVGGISDFINEDTGWLMPENAVPQDYAVAIEYILSHPEEAKRRVFNAQELLKTRHSEEAFRNSLYELYNLDPEEHSQRVLTSEEHYSEKLQKLYEQLPFEKLQKIYCDIIKYSMQQPTGQYDKDYEIVRLKEEYDKLHTWTEELDRAKKYLENQCTLKDSEIARLNEEYNTLHTWTKKLDHVKKDLENQRILKDSEIARLNDVSSRQEETIKKLKRKNKKKRHIIRWVIGIFLIYILCSLLIYFNIIPC